jgi:hypothetical protein
MIATSKEQYFLCSQLDPPTPKKNSHIGIQALTMCSQSTYLTNLRKKTLAAIQLGGGGVGWGRWKKWPKVAILQGKKRSWNRHTYLDNEFQLVETI